MASGQTEHYGLNQWAAEDAVLREAFNRDNAKTDMAINTNVSNTILVRLTEAVIGQDCEQVDLELPDRDLLQFSQIGLLIYAQTSGYSIYLRLNGQEQAIYQTLSTSNSTQAKSSYLIRTPAGSYISAQGFLTPFAEGSDTCCMLHSLCQASADFLHWPSAGRGPIPFSSLRTLNFYSDGIIKAGSRFSLYGVLL